MKSLPWREIATDIGFLAGSGLVAFGSWSIYEPAGFIVAGILVAAFSWMLAP